MAPIFLFSRQDIPLILERYRALLDFVCLPQHRGQVAYFALNMPVDDGAVTARLGGVNTPLSRERQKEYASAFVSAVRMETHRRGFQSARLYLSVFYGWDGTYHVPGYAEAGADGYFVNNYSYPAADGQAPALPARTKRLSTSPGCKERWSVFRSNTPGCLLWWSLVSIRWNTTGPLAQPDGRAGEGPRGQAARH